MFACAKINIARKPPALSYELEQVTDELVRVRWLGTSRLTADDLVDPETASDDGDAASWLTSYFGGCGWNGSVGVGDRLGPALGCLACPPGQVTVQCEGGHLGMDQHRAVRLGDEQPGGQRQMRAEPPYVVHAAPRNDKPHERQL